MRYLADLHIHSHYARATSRDLNLESLYRWARIKGVHVVGTGDFTHPLWFEELKEKLLPDGNGLFRLKSPPREPALPGARLHDIDVRFCLTAEVSSIYKKGDKVRKNHNLVYAPDLDTVARINARLGGIGNLRADGRPILGLPCRNLLEIVLEASPDAHLIPAHIWTPWFSLLGSKSGYDSLRECFDDLAHHIFAVETGLSSDPEMNWRLSALDRLALVSNSDAHSPQKLAREANLFDTELSYQGMFRALKTRQGFCGTLEFFPEEGKYHLDGHRKCGVRLEPRATLEQGGLCPSCGQPLTVGVLHRVETLADRVSPARPGDAPGFQYLIPLPEILGEIQGTGPASKAVQAAYVRALSAFGNEFALLREAAPEDIARRCGPVLAEAVARMRRREVDPQGGYDGEYGVIRVFRPGEVAELYGQTGFLGQVRPGSGTGKTRRGKVAEAAEAWKAGEPAEAYSGGDGEGAGAGRADDSARIVPAPSPAGAGSEARALNPEQEAVCRCVDRPCLVKAGPGTGKTHTLVHWAARLLGAGGAARGEVLAVTFTNKAADEIRVRIEGLLGPGSAAENVRTGTFHALAFAYLRERRPDLRRVYDDDARKLALGILFPEAPQVFLSRLSEDLRRFFESGEFPGPGPKGDGASGGIGGSGRAGPSLAEAAERYRAYLDGQGAVDMADIVGRLLESWEREPDWLRDCRASLLGLAVDEFQDINPLQYRFVRALGRDRPVLAIGDPDQSIYAFRGSDPGLFFRFRSDFGARESALTANYRSTPAILEAAGAVIRGSFLSEEHRLRAMRPPGARLWTFAAADPAEEARRLAAEIEKFVGGTSHLSLEAVAEEDRGHCGFSDIAVLFRTRRVGEELLPFIRRAGIPARFGDALPLLEEPPFSVVGHALRAILDPADPVSLQGLLLEGLGWEREAARAFLAALGRGEEEASAGLAPARRDGWRRWTSLRAECLEAAAGAGVSGLVAALGAAFLPDGELDTALALKKDNLLRLAAEAGADAEAFVRRVGLEPYADTARLGAEGVRFLTFHAAKGLEFPVVFIVGAEEGVTPLLRKDADPEEERRLFYVALTRARDALQISWSKTRERFGRQGEGRPSRFLAELPAHLVRRAEPPRRKQPGAEQLSLL